MKKPAAQRQSVSRAEAPHAACQAVRAELEHVKHTLSLILSELQNLRRVSLPADPNAIEALLNAIHAIFREAPFAAGWIIESAIETDADSVQLRTLLNQVLGPYPTAVGLSRLLSRAAGVYEHCKLEVTRLHSRDGRLFAVTPAT